jgi:hypothetical protein
MTDGKAAEPTPGTPSRRALGAMESAVRRARESQGGLPPTEPPRTSSTPTRPRRPPEPVGADRGSDQDDGGRRSERWLIASVAVAAVLVACAAIALAVSLSGGPEPAAPGSSTVTTAAPAHPGASPSSSHAGSGRRSGATSTTTTSTTAPVAAGGPPTISSLSPSSGSAGQGIVVAGANFISSDGQIVATFNGQVAPTSCPAQDACTVTVPPSSGSTSARVTITTAGGTSNAVTFVYG